MLEIPRHRSHVRIDLVLVHFQYSLTCLFAETKRIYCPGPSPSRRRAIRTQSKLRTTLPHSASIVLGYMYAVPSFVSICH